MNTLELIPLQNPVYTEVHVPGSLSYTIRALNLAAMTKGYVRIQNALISDDTEAMMNALETLGIKIEKRGTEITVCGSIYDVHEDNYTIDINISGRTARSLLGLLCIVPGVKTLTCQAGFKKRPVMELVRGLRQLGADIEYLEEEGYLPLKITSSVLNPGKVTMKGTISSQYVSSILMIAPVIGDIQIEIEGEQTSKPFIDVTIETMKQFGVVAINNAYRSYTVSAGQNYIQSEFSVEADAIAAGYFWGIAAVSQSTIRVTNLPPKTLQGDAALADLLSDMGCEIEKNDQQCWISVTGPKHLKAISANMNSLPDSAQTLAVVAAFASGTTHIYGLDNARIKETDRISAPLNELKKLGIDCSDTESTLTVHGGSPHGGTVKTYGDHRMAMSFAIAGSAIPGVTIESPEVVSKSFPTFWNVLEKLGVTTKTNV